ncbi:hypothetical protein J4530_00295 [Neisseria subflava]|uniref:hypothetical protein n=1 Tax=Neisseria subflava TaxID=28449 RepID=UPI00202A0C5E|nr:hypothetical protein [Neisseria subflava]MCL9786727.1 hypothetical protein [Neisseria subflava]
MFDFSEDAKDALMREWADWRRRAVQVGPNGYKPSSLNILMAGGTPGGGGFHSVVLSYGADVDSVFVQIDRAVNQLPMIPRSVVRRYYQQPGTVDQKAADLGCRAERCISCAIRLLIRCLRCAVKKDVKSCLTVYVNCA